MIVNGIVKFANAGVGLQRAILENEHGRQRLAELYDFTCFSRTIRVVIMAHPPPGLSP